MSIPRIFGADKKRREAEAKECIRKAAPALLEALEEITDVYCKRLSGGGWNPDLDPDVIKSRAAIAAAKGE